jgi:hypothetical protein
MFRAILLSIAFPAIAGGLSLQQPVADNPRPVRVLKQPGVQDIEFVRFEFQEPALYHLRVHYGEIDGEPRTGEKYGVAASIGGEEAIASVSFDAIDGSGRMIQRVPMARTREHGYSEFLGLMEVPAQPFRIVMSGEGVDGRTFRLVYARLFNPMDVAKAPSRPHRDMPGDMAAAFEQMLAELAPETIAKREALVAGNAGGQIVMPQMQVSALSYAPLLSPSGRPIGVRVTYDVTFSEHGEYSPHLFVSPVEKGDILIDTNPMNVVKSRITPVPGELQGVKYEYMYKTARSEHRHVAVFLYQPGTVYKFEVELVPNFIGFERDNVTPCFAGKDFQLKWNGQDRLALRLEAPEPAKYRLSIDTAGVKGVLENFYSERTFHQTFIAEGLRNCER